MAPPMAALRSRAPRSSSSSTVTVASTTHSAGTGTPSNCNVSRGSLALLRPGRTRDGTGRTTVLRPSPLCASATVR
jgi:hypothetical protein